MLSLKKLQPSEQTIALLNKAFEKHWADLKVNLLNVETNNFNYVKSCSLFGLKDQMLDGEALCWFGLDIIIGYEIRYYNRA